MVFVGFQDGCLPSLGQESGNVWKPLFGSKPPFLRPRSSHCRHLGAGKIPPKKNKLSVAMTRSSSPSSMGLPPKTAPVRPGSPRLEAQMPCPTPLSTSLKQNQIDSTLRGRGEPRMKLSSLILRDGWPDQTTNQLSKV